MSNTQTISGITSNVSPFRAIADNADFVVCTVGGSIPPTVTVLFGKLTPGKDAVPGTPAIPQKSGPNLPDYVPAVPATPDTPAVPASFAPHRQEQFTLSTDEWNNWDNSVSDDVYILSLVAKHYGITLTA